MHMSKNLVRLWLSQVPPIKMELGEGSVSVGEEEAELIHVGLMRKNLQYPVKISKTLITQMCTDNLSSYNWWQ